jgi:hypothetical protein
MRLKNTKDFMVLSLCILFDLLGKLVGEPQGFRKAVFLGAT